MGFSVWVWVDGEDGSRRQVFHKSLGPEATIFAYWHTVAFQLELPLVAQIYNEGLEVRGPWLQELWVELDKLERHWQSTHTGGCEQIPRSVRLPNGKIGDQPINLLDYLLEKLNFVREAIRLATKFSGAVQIS
jgi:hypothetical protein